MSSGPPRFRQGAQVQGHLKLHHELITCVNSNSKKKQNQKKWNLWICSFSQARRRSNWKQPASSGPSPRSSNLSASHVSGLVVSKVWSCCLKSFFGPNWSVPWLVDYEASTSNSTQAKTYIYILYMHIIVIHITLYNFVYLHNWHLQYPELQLSINQTLSTCHRDVHHRIISTNSVKLHQVTHGPWVSRLASLRAT